MYLLYRFAVAAYGAWTSPGKDLPGPPNPSLLFGNMKEFWRLVGVVDYTFLHPNWNRQVWARMSVGSSYMGQCLPTVFWDR